MATSDAMPRRPRRFHRVVPCLLLCAALPRLFDALHRLSFVQGVALHGTRAAQRQVAQRFSRKRQQTPVEQDEDSDAEARRLTSSIKTANTANKLIEVLDGAVDGPIFNFSHASAAYTQLERLKRRQVKRHWGSPVLLRLHARAENMIRNDQLNAEASANILWSIATLSERFSIPTKLLVALVKSLPTKVNGMKQQGLSNSLWACARLHRREPFVLTMLAALVAQIPAKAKDMNPQDLSSTLWAFAQLKQDVARDLCVKVVPAIAAEILEKAKDMNRQDLSNNLWAFSQLKDFVPDALEVVPALIGEILVHVKNMKPLQLADSLEAVIPQDCMLCMEVYEVEDFPAGSQEFVRSAAARLNSALSRRLGKGWSFAVPVILWACAKAEVYDGELLESVARRLRSKLWVLSDFGVCALSWSYQVLDTDDDFEDFKTLLMSETEKRGFSEEIVHWCEHGRSEWVFRIR